MGEEISYLIARFPNHRIIIQDAYHNNDEFKILCDDFYTSAQVIQKFQTTQPENIKVAQEYQHVFVELEKEIVEYLKSDGRKYSGGVRLV